jgi:hypothetical protein
MSVFPLSTKADGMAMTSGPLDVVKVVSGPAVVPTPTPNIAQIKQADPTKCSQKVKVVSQPALIKDSQVPMSSGDEVGASGGGGVVSGTVKGPVLFKKFSTKVKIEGANAVYQLCNTTHNGTSPNAPLGMQTTPSQTKVKVMS